MNIGIDISQIVYEGTGVARFTNGLVNAILDYDKNNHWLFFFSSLRQDLDKNLEQKINNKGHQLVKWKLPPTLLSFLWNDLHQFSIFNFQFSIPLDYLITSDWTEPPIKNINKTTIVHDLVYLRYPKTVDKKILETQRKRLSWIKKESKIIFADSETTKNDLINLLGIKKERILVNYPGADIVKPTNFQIKQTLQKYNLKRPFILTVGKLEPRKNLKRLIEAIQPFDKAQGKQFNNLTIDLVIVGPSGWDKTIQQFDNLTMKQWDNVKFLGYISDEELYSLYSSCLFFIFPSIWEGFGFPIVEAMKLGTPVTCSNTSSMKEIAQDAALLFNPLSIEEMYQSIDKLIQDKNLREELIKKGLERSKIFSWKNYYNKLMANL